MSSPRPQPQGQTPKADSYGELGLRNTRETPGFFQHSVTGEPTARFSMQSPSSSAEPIAFDESDSFFDVDQLRKSCFVPPPDHVVHHVHRL